MTASAISTYVHVATPWLPGRRPGADDQQRCSLSVRLRLGGRRPGGGPRSSTHARHRRAGRSDEAHRRDLPVHTGSAIIEAARQASRVNGCDGRTDRRDGVNGSWARASVIDCDTMASSGGWSPGSAPVLPYRDAPGLEQRRHRLRARVSVPSRSDSGRQRQWRGEHLQLCLADGHRAGSAARHAARGSAGSSGRNRRACAATNVQEQARASSGA